MSIEVPDNFNVPILESLLDIYTESYHKINALNLKLNQGNKKIRHQNFNSEISENIAKFAYYKKYPEKGLPTWTTDKGDMTLKGKQIEVKGFMSDGPSSFGPTEDWDIILFVDCRDFDSKKFIVYEINLSNKSDSWRNIILSGSLFKDKNNVPDLPEDLDSLKTIELKELCQKRGLSKTGNKENLITKLINQAPGSKYKKIKTYGEIADNKRRGELRGCFYKIFKPQLGDKCKEIFNGHISELNII